MRVDPDPPELAAAVEWRCDSASLQRLLIEVVPQAMPPSSVVFLRAAAETAGRDGSALDLAAELSMSPRMLSRALARARLPTGVRLLIWMHLLIAAKVLDQPGASIELAAERSGYSAGSALRRALKTLTGMTPTALIAGGAFATAKSLFAAEIAPATTRPRG